MYVVHYLIRYTNPHPWAINFAWWFHFTKTPLTLSSPKILTLETSLTFRIQL